jgi:hypothetical protein
MAIEYTNLFHCKALQNLPKLGFLVWKYPIWQPWWKASKTFERGRKSGRLAGNWQISIIIFCRLQEYLNVHACMHTYIHAYIHAYIHIHTCMHTYIHTYIHTCMHTYMHAYIHTCIHAYMHTCIHTHTYIHRYIQSGHSSLRSHCVGIKICLRRTMHLCMQEPILRLLNLQLQRRHCSM